MQLPRNLHLVDDIKSPTCPIPRFTSIHATNGTYAYDADLIVPTTLGAFQFIKENNAVRCNAHHIFLIGVNSDVSMAGIMDAKNASRAERDALEDQQTRALKVAVPLALQHPDRTIVVAYYDEPTPTELYRSLIEDVGADLNTLHKWGYGTASDAPKIEGAQFFRLVFGFPMPNDKKPLCHDITPLENQPQVNVFRLTHSVGMKPPYLSTDGKILFPVNDPSLDRYTQKGFEEARAHAALLVERKPEQP